MLRVVSLFLLVLLASTACRFLDRPARPEGLEGPFVLAEDGVPISYAVSGEGARTVVFIHGWSCDRTYWREQVSPFSNRRRVIVIDLPGHGASGVARAEWSFDGFARDAVRVLEEEDVEGAVLVGHSMGGPVALLAAGLAPERVAGVIGVEALHDADARMTDVQAAQLVAMYEQDFAGTSRRFATAMFPEGTDPQLVRRVADDMASAPPDVAVGIVRVFPTFDLKGALGATKVPVRAINSAITMPTNVEANRRYREDYDAVAMAGVGHFPMLERPQEFNALLETTLSEVERAGRGR